MNNVVDVIETNGKPLAVISSEELPVDLLNRQGIVDRIIHLLNIISDNRSSCAFAINGMWGSGKTFVLNMLMKQLLDYQDGEKYLVFHYNCWQYDYYEEPLIAIVAAMMDSVDQETHIFSRNLREKAKRGMATAKLILEVLAKDFIKNKIGVDLSNLFDLIKSGADSLEAFEEKDADTYDYDDYYAFKKVMSTAQESIRALGRDRTVVVIVDELDRCLPGYAIKLMERLHHLFSGVDNVAVILATDKAQLEQTVKQIFGDSTDTTKYLKKFINFEIQLDLGRIAGGFTEKYAEYISLFDESLMDSSFSLDDYVSALFADIDARTQERLMERIKLVHSMLFQGTQRDYSFMCFELMWIVFKERYGKLDEMPITYNPSLINTKFEMRGSNMCTFSKYMKDSWGHVHVFTNYRGTPEKVYHEFPQPVEIPKLLIWYLSKMFDDRYTVYGFENKGIEKVYQKNVAELREVIKLLEIIN